MCQNETNILNTTSKQWYVNNNLKFSFTNSCSKIKQLTVSFLWAFIVSSNESKMFQSEWTSGQQRKTSLCCSRDQQLKDHIHNLNFQLFACRLVSNSSTRSFINWQQQSRSFSQRTFNWWRDTCVLQPQKHRTSAKQANKRPRGWWRANMTRIDCSVISFG